MGERAGGMDAAFLEMETPAMHLHVVGVLVLDPSTSPDPLTPERLAALYAERLHLLAPFRRRIVEVPAGLDHPWWVDDPDFDLSRHLHHRSVGPGAGRAELEAFVGELASTPLPRDRPLWQSWLLDGFADGTVALVTKVHHAMLDGAAGADMMASLFDLEPEPAPSEPPPDFDGEPVPSATALVLGAGPAALGRAVRLPGAVVRTAANLASSARDIAGQPSSVVRLAPRTPFNGALTGQRAVALSRCSLDDLLAVRTAFGVTVNDVVLAATSMSLRRYLDERGWPTDQALVASVPVAGERDGGSAFGNQVSNVMVELPVHLEDPADVVAHTHRAASGAKAASGALDPEIMNEWVSLLPAALLSAGAAAYTGLGLGRLHPPLFNCIVSNVAGPPIPLYLAGARLVGTYPMGPLITSGLNLTVFSIDGWLDIGVIACPDLVDDVDDLVDGFVDAVAELLVAAQERSDVDDVTDGAPIGSQER